MLIKKLLHRILIFCILILACVAIWYHSTTIAPTAFKIDHITFSASQIPEAFNDFKIGFISDFDLQTSEDLDYLERCIQKLNQQACNMVIFGGDLYAKGVIFDEERLISLLKSIQTTDGKFAVLGECEFLDNLEGSIQILESGGFEVMRNQAHPIYYQDSSIIFAGMETSGEVDSLLTEEEQNNFIVAAVHQPDYFREISQSSATLQLSGHSGGGYIYIPFIGATVKFDGANEYNHGHYEINNHHLYIANGVGMGHEQSARFNCYPEALVITLKSQTENIASTD